MSEPEHEREEPVEIAEQTNGTEESGAQPAETVAEAGDGDATGVEPTLEQRVAEAEARAAEYLDGWQRERAEFANARKRLEKSRAESRQNATIEVISRLLPILDDFERALDTAPAGIAQDDWYDGIVLVHRKLVGMLENERIERIATVGEAFDPNVHEAVMQETSDEYESGTVVRELQSGYRLDQRVIRPAMVIVAE
jgi:molecular chaperone GrpE